MIVSVAVLGHVDKSKQRKKTAQHRTDRTSNVEGRYGMVQNMCECHGDKRTIVLRRAWHCGLDLNALIVVARIWVFEWKGSSCVHTRPSKCMLSKAAWQAWWQWGWVIECGIGIVRASVSGCC